jgi:hypothetical protein
VDEKSVQDTRASVEHAERGIQNIRDEMRQVEQSSANIYQELSKDNERRYWNTLYSTTEEYWRKRLELVRGKASEEKAIMESLASDLLKIQQMQEKEVESARNESAARQGLPTGDGGGGFGTAGLFGQFSSILRGIGWGPMLGVGTAAGAAATIARSVAEIRGTESVSRDIAGAAGQDAGFAESLAPMIRRLEQKFPGQIDTKGAGRIAAELAPIAPGGEIGGEMVGRTAEQAFELGRSLGADPQSIARLMRQFATLEGDALPKLSSRVNEVANAAEAANVPFKDFNEWLLSAAENGKLYNRSLPETTRLIGLFGQELYQGLISVSEITNAQNATARAPIGVQAMLGERVLSRGGALGSFLTRIGSTDPLSAGATVRALAEGYLPTAEGGLLGEDEMSGGQRGLLRRLQASIRAEMPAMVREMAGGVGGNVGPMGRTYLEQQLFGDIMGIEARTMGMTQELTERGGRLEGGGILEAGKNIAQRLNEGAESAQKSTTAFERANAAVTNFSDSIVLSGRLMAAEAKGDWTEAEKIRSQLANSGKPGSLGWYGAQPAISDREVGQFWVDVFKDVFKNITIKVDNRASDKVDVKTSVGESHTPQGAGGR